MRSFRVLLLLTASVGAQDKREISSRPRSHLEAVVVGNELAVRTFEEGTLAFLSLPKGKTVTLLTFSSHEKYVAAAFAGGEIVVWGTADDKAWQKGSKVMEICTFRCREYHDFLDFEADTLEAMGNGIEKWSMETKKLLSSTEPFPLLMADPKEGKVKVTWTIGPNRGKEVRSFPTKGIADFAWVSDDGKYVTASTKEGVFVWSLATGKQLFRKDGPGLFGVFDNKKPRTILILEGLIPRSYTFDADQAMDAQ